ncbi:biotin/lipoyl-binding protein [Undibacterium cyanobacteriorum]|uniref:Biotin/lipoyl-binding protein n=1 Tax=Undibacterium cyanobacteriorum TaxID=3073561 RepID=A0ABY9RGE2_9BURK|nr:biotin/lipoyl-binding protein [Undibacterium sp. 20NA77.5]WMW79710.1 biotin/lipoyl-binding protein [Undibacterium sp. 20NA77.5]
MSDARSPLFRTEVTQALSQQSLGSIRLAQPISSWLIALVAAIIATILILFIWLASFDRKARVTGVIVPSTGSVSLSSNTPGILSQLLIKEGDTVKAGQALFEISNERQNKQGEISDLIKQQLSLRRQTLDSELRLSSHQAQEKTEAFALRLKNNTQEGLQLDQEIDLMERRQRLAQDNLHRFQSLQSNGYVSAAQVQQKHEEIIEISSRLSALKRNQLQINSNRLAIEADLKNIKINLASEQSQLHRAIAMLDQETVENDSRKNTIIKAQQDGTVTIITGQLGQQVVPGQTIATLIPSTTATDKTNPSTPSAMEVQLFAPSRTSGFVSVGQEVLIRYTAFPYQKFGLQKGVIESISTTPIAPTELPSHLASTILSNAQQSISGFNSSEALYRIKVKLEKQTIETYGKVHPLKSGMTLEADIVQDNRKIWEWLAEPILAVAKR